MKTDAVIVGGGIAGIWCARELSCMGLSSVIVEKAPFLGGHAARFCCKAIDACQRCGACVLEDVLGYAGASDRITVLTRATVEGFRRENGHFSFSLLRKPPRIFPEQCSGCGQCEKVCPVPGALVRSPSGSQPAIDEDACLFFRDGSCRACSEVCPELAVKFDGTTEIVSAYAPAAVCATGFRPYDAREKPQFGYGLVPGVMTALELDSMMRLENWTLRPAGEPISSVAFIQCVGSRDAKIGRNYCSRVCCGYALRMARLLKSRFPLMSPSMFYMDIQTFDRDFERRLSEAEKEVRLIRSIPSEIRRGSDGRPEVVYHGLDDQRVIESFDAVVLSIGMSPEPSEEFSALALNEDGFFGMDGEDVASSMEGVFVAGAAQGPKSITDSISHAVRAAGRVAAYLETLAEGGGR